MERIAILQEWLRSSLWVLPAVSVLAALGLGTWLAGVELELPGTVRTLLFAGDAEAARSILAAVAGALITVTGLVFSLTVLTLQVASSQYSPRLWGNFLQDRGNQVVLGIFLSTFTYSLAVLRTMSGDEVPEVAMSGALLLVVASLAALVFVIHHIAHSIRLDTVLRQSQQATLSAIERNHPERVAGAEWREPLPEVPTRAVVVPARRSGVVQTLAPERLLGPAVAHDVVVRFARCVGESVVEGDPLAWVWAHSSTRGQPDPGAFARPMKRAVHIGGERTLVQDAAFGVRQLTDIAVRALSPGINDPTTAVDATERLTVVLVRLAGRRLGNRLLTDKTNTLRVALPRREFDGYVALACDQIRRYGASEPEVAAALLQMLTTVAGVTRSTERRGVVATHVDRVVAAAERAVAEEELEAVRQAEEAARAMLRAPVMQAPSLEPPRLTPPSR